MAQLVFDKIQLGRQSAFVTPVAATTGYPGKATSWALDRGYNNPDEDYGRLSDEQPGRGSFGLRGAGWSLDSEIRFEDYMHPCDMHFGTAGAPSGIGPYTYTHTADETSLTPKPYTLEMGSETAQDQWRLTGALATSVSMGFDALTAPGNAPWNTTVSGIAIDRSITALTGAITAPTTLETAEGHLTLLYEGTTATAFASLAELAASLVHFRFTSTVPYVLLGYGSASDTATDRGVSGKAGVTFEASVKIAATAKSDTHDIFNTAGSVVQERRWRVKAFGSGTKTLTLDTRVRFHTVDRADRNGEAIYGIAGSMVYDSTLAARLQIVGINSVASIP